MSKLNFGYLNNPFKTLKALPATVLTHKDLGKKIFLIEDGAIFMGILKLTESNITMSESYTPFSVERKDGCDTVIMKNEFIIFDENNIIEKLRNIIDEVWIS